MSTNETSTKSAPLPWIVLSGILGVFAVAVPVTQNNSPTKKEAEKTNPAPKAAVDSGHLSGTDPLKPIYDFHTSDSRGVSEADLRKFAHGYDLEFLIATVPDPIDTPHGHAFDQAIDAIQRAVEKKDGYILDRAWLPWEIDRHHQTKDDKTGEFSKLRETSPGVLLFRHGKDRNHQIEQPSVCMVFLVGESITGGLHKRAFTKALEIMSALGHSVDKPVRIIGPHFSGSQTSLQFVIADWWEGAASWFRLHQMYRFEIITGNASAIRKKDFFELNGYRDAYPHWQPDKISFSATVVPTKTILNATLRYLARRDGCNADEWVSSNITNRVPEKIAILVESNTSLGKQFAALAKDEQLLVLRFPLHISQVKSEFTQALRKKDEQNGLRNDNTLIPANFEVSGAPVEGIPSQGGQTTTATNGQILSSILATVGKEQCRYVGVIASDARDKLFLIRLIREYCPDVHVFVTDADQLLMNPEYRYQMRGVIVGSTYPLIPANQRWVRPKAVERILFPSVGAQGYYNATLLQLGMYNRLLEYRAPAFVTSSDDKTTDLATRRPPIWISIVSPNGSMIPLQMFTNYEDPDGYVHLNPAPLHQETVSATLEYPGAMLPIGLILIVFWIFLVYQAWFNPSAGMFWQTTLDTVEFSLPQLCYRNVLLGSQAVLAVPVLAIVWIHALANQFRSIWMAPFCGLMIGIVGLLLLGMLKPLCWPPTRLRQIMRWLRPRELHHGRPELWNWAMVNITVTGGAIAFAILFLARFWIYGGEVRRTLFYIRAVDLSTGLSPMTPLIFIAASFLAWAYFQLKRNHIDTRYHIPNPYPSTTEDHEGFRRLSKLDAITQDESRHELVLLRHPRTAGLLTLFVVGLALAVWLESLPSMEGWSWDGMFFIGFVILFGLNATTIIRLLWLWHSTKKILRAITLLPMMRIFVRLPTKITDVFGKFLITQRPHLAHLEVQAHQLRLLVQALANDSNAPTELMELGTVSETIRQLLSEHLESGVSRSEILQAERKIRSILSGASAICLRVLAQRWSALSVEAAYGDGGGQSTSNDPAWVHLAENLAATQSILHISQYFIQLRNLVCSVMVSASLLLMAATSYPFHPEHLLLISVIGLMSSGIVAVFYMLIEMNRDEWISRISNTTPGRFSLDSGFFGSFLTYIVPAVGVLIAQLSGSFRWLLEPILRVMK